MTGPDDGQAGTAEGEPEKAPEPEEIDPQALLNAVTRAIATLRKDAARAFPGDPSPERGADEGDGAARKRSAP